MKTLWRPGILVGILLTWVGLLLLDAQQGMAFTPKWDYWFIEAISVSEVTLPSGVAIHPGNQSDTPRASLILENQTETVLYVLSLNYVNNLVMPTPDPNWKSRVKMAHEVASYQVLSSQPLYLSTEALADLDSNLVDRNVLSMEPPPADAPIPAAQSSQLLLVYGEQVIVVPFVLSYTLNTRYDNGSQAYLHFMAGVQATDNASATATQQVRAAALRETRTNILVAGLAGLAVCLIAGWLVWRAFLRPRITLGKH